MECMYFKVTTKPTIKVERLPRCTPSCTLVRSAVIPCSVRRARVGSHSGSPGDELL